MIQFEDFAGHNAYRLLEKYKHKYCTFNDDIQGTASVVVSGILTALKTTNTKLSDHTILFQGAGSANLGIANLISRAIEKKEGISQEEARKKMWMKDSSGLIVRNRPDGKITGQRENYAHEHTPMNDLSEMVNDLKPSILIGAAAVPGVFTQQIIEDMARINSQPIIFALSNPTSHAECTAEEVYKYSDGRAVFATGSPFPSYEMNGKRFEPGQGNNAYIFPGVALGTICCGLRHIDDDIFLAAAEALSGMVTEKDLEVGRMYPSLSVIRDCSLKIAVGIAETAYANKLATIYPEPKDKIEFIKNHLYDYNYDGLSALPAIYKYPAIAYGSI